MDSERTEEIQVNCRQHRSSMELLGLRLRLNRGISDQRERDQIEKRIRMLEKELDMD